MFINQLAYLRLNATDCRRWQIFGAEILGMQLMEQGGDGSLYLRMDDYHHRIAVSPAAKDELASTGWLIKDTDALASLEHRLRDAGVSIESVESEELARRNVTAMFRCKDPSGYTLEFFSGLFAVTNKPFHPGRPMSGFKTGQLGLGHITLASTASVERNVAFYRDLLGFTVSDYIDLEAFGKGTGGVFFHCNPRHHSLALIGSPQTNARAILHVMIEVNALDDVGRLIDLCYQQRVRITRQLGKHTNDHMIACYVRTPSGFDVEYGWGGRLVEESTWYAEKHACSRAWGAQSAQEELERAKLMLEIAEQEAALSAQRIEGTNHERHR